MKKMKRSINDRIRSVRDGKTVKIVSDLERDMGVNIFYHVNRKPEDPTRYSPSNEVGRGSYLDLLFRNAITEHRGNWKEMEKRGYLEPEIKKVELDLGRVIYARDWDDPNKFTEYNYDGGEIIEITTGGRGGMIHRSPIEFAGSEKLIRLTCGFDFYSLTNGNKLQRDQFTAVAGSPDFGSFGESFVTDIKYQRKVCGSNNRLLRSISRIVDCRRKNPFDKEAWEVYKKVLIGGRK